MTPVFNEYSRWSPNYQSRLGRKVDLWLIHTQEGAGNADSLASFLDNPASGVSYHYTIDNGVNVCDVVDTTQASWSVLDANNRAINLCFAGSTINWSRQQWLDNMGAAIDVAAYLAVRDCRKYGIPLTVIPPPYNSDPPGISDHRYVTQHLGIGTHVDVGNNFPWDVFTAAVNKYANPDPVEELMATNQEKLDAIYDKLLAYPDSPDIAGKWKSRSRYAPDGQGGVDDTVGMILNTDATVYDILIETAAVAGDPDSRAVIAARAKAHPDDKRAVFFSTKYPA